MEYIDHISNEMNSMEFRAIGTNTLRIGLRCKVGSSYLTEVSNHNDVLSDHYTYYNQDNPPTYVIVLRDPYEHWETGMHTDMTDWMDSILQALPYIHTSLHELRNTNLSTYINKFLNNEDEMLRPDYIQLFHFIKLAMKNRPIWDDSGIHNKFDSWNDYTSDSEYQPVSNKGIESLEWLTKQPNIYFVDLKDLSNPKFHEWLTIKDGKWSEVDWIDYKALYSDGRETKLGRWFWPNVNLIHGEPIEPDREVLTAVTNELNSIRKNHERFVNLNDT